MTAVYPDPEFVHADAGPYGPTGAEFTPGLSALAGWALKYVSPWPAASAEPVLEICDAVTAAINDATLPEVVTAAVSFLEVDTPLEDLEGETLVEVAFPDPPRPQWIDRGHTRYDVPIQVGIRYKFDADDQAAGSPKIDPEAIRAKLNLQAAIRRVLIGIREIPTTSFGAAVELTPPVVASEYNRKHLRELRQFTGVVKYQFSITVAE